MTYVLDASVLLKWFVEESESPQAITYRSRLLEGTVSIACPDLALYEVGNVLRHKRGVPAHAMTNAIVDLLHLQLDIFTPSESLLRRSAEIAYAKHLTFYDAAYVALAQELNATLVSADLGLCHHVRGLLPVEPLIAVR